MMLRFLIAVTSLDLFYFLLGDQHLVCINMEYLLNCSCLNNSGTFVWTSPRSEQISENSMIGETFNHSFSLEPRSYNCYDLVIKRMDASLQGTYTCAWDGEPKLNSTSFNVTLRDETKCQNTSDRETVTYLNGKDTNSTSSTETDRGTFQLDTVHYYLLGCLGVLTVMLLSIKMLSIWKSGRCEGTMSICNQATTEQSHGSVEAIQLQVVTAESEEDNPYTEID